MRVKQDAGTECLHQYMHRYTPRQARARWPVTAALPYAGGSTHPAMRSPTQVGSPRASSASMAGSWKTWSRVIPPNERDLRGIWSHTSCVVNVGAGVSGLNSALPVGGRLWLLVVSGTGRSQRCTVDGVLLLWGWVVKGEPRSSCFRFLCF